MAYEMMLVALMVSGQATTPGTGIVTELSTMGITSLVALIGGAATTYWFIRKNRNEENAAAKNYQKDLSNAMAADIAKLRKSSEKYLILRKLVISEPGIPHADLLSKMEAEYKLINPNED